MYNKEEAKELVERSPQQREWDAQLNRMEDNVKSLSKETEKHTETIKCPECDKIQDALVEHSYPWFTHVHECVRCKHTIMESEWNVVARPQWKEWQSYASFCHEVKKFYESPQRSNSITLNPIKNKEYERIYS